MKITNRHFRDLDKCQEPTDFQLFCKGKNIQLLLDGDIFAYRAAAAIERDLYLVGDKVFKYKKEAIEYARGDPSKIIKEHITGSLKVACRNVMSMIYTVISEIEDFAESVDTKVFFSSKKKNYRLLRYPTYKANRDNIRRPKHLMDVKEYLCQYEGVSFARGIEADDLIGIHMTTHDPGVTPVIVTIDKDLKQIPGPYYNFVTGEFTVTDEYEALKQLFLQALIGDTADNIQGVYGIGKVKAAKILEDVPYDDLYWTARACYEAAGLTKADLHAALDMLYVLRYEHETVLDNPWENFIKVKDIG